MKLKEEYKRSVLSMDIYEYLDNAIKNAMCEGKNEICLNLDIVTDLCYIHKNKHDKEEDFDERMGKFYYLINEVEIVLDKCGFKTNISWNNNTYDKFIIEWD